MPVAFANVLDVSGNQPPEIAFPQVKGSGIDAMWLKATEGVGSPDPHFRSYAAGCRQAGIPFGAYHYFHVRAGQGQNQDGAEQAREFVAAYRASGATLPWALDVESLGNTVDVNQKPLPNQPTTAEWLAGLRQFVAVATAALGKGIIYTSPGEWTSFGLSGATDFAALDLWVAHLGVPTPDIPGPWTSWRLWQYSWTGHIPGIAGNTDRSYFHGTPADLLVWAYGPQASTVVKLGFLGLVAYALWKAWPLFK